MNHAVKVEVKFDDKKMDEEVKPSIGATFYQMFQVGPSRYAAFERENTIYLLKIVEVNGTDEFHDIESQHEFDSILEVFKDLNKKI
ncbi:DUF1292 domain-containing protein [Ammoniphilus resinae]|uniref:DUF1292 domain-containing protein n=1 Tax=Ammoniphilus resinae TaxID=861532 RepID=A0ABS4GNE1_9BACL|nr:DUF1292 domain-containing protein [Ammoniphilus resinae]MBP1931796.1 hypothetical protein [Ammoniphilus resinae]